MNTATPEAVRAAHVAREIRRHGGIPLAYVQTVRQQIRLMVAHKAQVPMELLLEASFLEQYVIAGLLEYMRMCEP